MSHSPPHGAMSWVPTARPRAWYIRLWDPFWMLPMACVAVSVLLGIVLPQVDSLASDWVPVVFHGGPDGARTVLSTITSAMISVTGLVFSITMVLVQLASSQFSQRVLGGFLGSKITQATLGVFTGTFMYSLTVLRSIRDQANAESAFVPQVATTFCFLLVIASVGFFLAFIDHIISSIRIANVVEEIRAKTVATGERMIPADLQPEEDGAEAGQWTPPPGDKPWEVRWRKRGGRLTDVDYRRLVEVASENNLIVSLLPQVGAYVPRGSAVLAIYGIPDERVPGPSAPGTAVPAGSQETPLRQAAEDMLGCLTCAQERSMRQDVMFGVRQIVDIAERALSPGINDPTTAVQCLDALHGLLRPLVQRRTPQGQVSDARGHVRLVYRPQTVHQVLELATDEISWWGAGTIQVPRRMKTMVDDLLSVAAPEYREHLHRVRERVERRDAKAGESEPGSSDL
ncbi:DUF2254 domain-containing protein [Corynebacterium heidelbergense]|uniref:DUF2254 domain-containing protein n=1 Tax=Corynebacterium heidelbergense TaxID=2055947 RepID=A0A364V500_9CORY|nr:DUF2254 domain-containing protein [Corynebacterium heidelbergense]RAV31688.1 DUF2254 domain-containing protein [Corynebacterium heidelbergense]